MNKIQEIHNSDLYGIIVETGCGVALTSALMSEAGASKTVYHSSQPYSKDYEKEKYGDFSRSVSVEFVTEVVKRELKELKDPRVNFILATSWQLNDDDPKKYAHGWYCLVTLDTRFKPHVHEFSTVHFSIPRSLNIKRNQAFEIISDIGVSMLHVAMNNIGKVDGNLQGLEIEYTGNAILDIAKRINTNYFLPLKMLENRDIDYPLVFTKDGMIRFEDLMRQSDQFIIQKGSFNPLHHQHKHMMDKSVELHPKAKPVFLISTFRYDKPHIDVMELVDRIQNITKHGYDVIVCKEIFFYATFNMFKRWADKDKKFYFVVGTDTINRIYQADDNAVAAKHGGQSAPFATKVFIDGMVRIYSNQFQFLVLPRSGYTLVDNIHWYDGMTQFVSEYEDDGTSSTKIRTSEIENKLD